MTQSFVERAFRLLLETFAIDESISILLYNLFDLTQYGSMNWDDLFWHVYVLSAFEESSNRDNVCISMNSFGSPHHFKV